MTIWSPNVWLWYDDVWNDITDDVRVEPPITIRFGKTNETTAPVPTQINLTLNNRENAYDPQNPMSDLYALDSRNMPIQVGFNEIKEDFEDTTYNITWSTYGNQAAARTTAKHHTGTASLGIVTGLTGNQIAGVTFSGLNKNSKNTIEFWYYTSISSSSFLAAYNGENQLVWFITGSTSQWTHVSFDVGPYDTFSIEYQHNSATNGTDTFHLDDVRILDARGTGEVFKWAPTSSDDWDPVTGRGDATTAVSAGGVLRRVNANTRSARSAYRRGIDYATNVISCAWTCEDESGSPIAASVTGGMPMSPVTEVRYTLPGGQPISPGGAPDFGRGSGVPGLNKLPDFTRGGTLRGYVENTGDVTTGYAIDWVMQFQAGTDAGGTTSADVFAWRETGTYVHFICNVVKGSVTVSHATAVSDLTLTTVGGAVAFIDPYDGAPHHYRYQVTQNGADYNALFIVDGTIWDTADNVATPGHMAGTIGTPIFVEFNPGEASGNFMPIAAGGVVVWASGAIGAQDDLYTPAHGYPTEKVEKRMARLGTQEGFEVAFDDLRQSGTRRMGPQRVGKTGELLAEMERTEDGILFDQRGGLAVMLRTYEAMLNRPADLAITYGSGDGGVQALKPVTDDAAIRNDVTAENADGANYRSEVLAGNLGSGIAGSYPATVKVNVDTNSTPISNVATWWSAKGTIDDPRYPTIVFDFDANPTLGASAGRLRPGDRITINGVTYDQTNLRILGGTEIVGKDRRTLALVCDPGRVWKTGVLNTARLQDEDTYIPSAIGVTTTSLSLEVFFGLFSTKGIGDFGARWRPGASGVHVMIGGEEIILGTISARVYTGNPSWTSTWTVTGCTRGVNGVHKSHSAFETVRVKDAIRLKL